ncbi:MAG: hypothetical protein ACRDHF_10470 [Tepidiformaceae bacterium]
MAATKRDTPTDDLEVEGVQHMKPEQTRELFDELARKVFGISGDEFLRRWDAGEYAAAAGHGATNAEHHAVWRVAWLIPFAR